MVPRGRGAPPLPDAGSQPAAAAPRAPVVDDRPAPGLADLRAAIALVESGMASRVVLSGVPSWPGLLWQAYELARDSHVIVLPTIASEGGGVDIVVARDEGADPGAEREEARG